MTGRRRASLAVLNPSRPTGRTLPLAGRYGAAAPFEGVRGDEERGSRGGEGFPTTRSRCGHVSMRIGNGEDMIDGSSSRHRSKNERSGTDQRELITAKSVDTKWTPMKFGIYPPMAVIAELIDFLRKTGAGEGIRTLDPNLGKVVLYP